MASCTRCGANWSQEQFSPDCDECGGGAMEIACPICEGQCGARWQRAVIDSQDFKRAHWIGGCSLPMEEQQAMLQRQIKQTKNRK